MPKIKVIYSLITISMALAVPGFVQAAEVRNIVFPIAQEYAYDKFADTYNDPRWGGRVHLGTDIMVDKMTPLVAAVDGSIDYLTETEASWGMALYLRDDDGYSYRYLHINNDTPGTDDNKAIRAYAFPKNITRGTRVTAGQVVAWAGDSGNAENVGSHLHFEIWTPDRTSINSYPSLMAAIGQPLPAGDGVAPISYQFTRDLVYGSQGEDVRELQKYLNRAGFIVSTTGAGSPGNESTYFGPATQAALIKFQKFKNISPATGYFGLSTRVIMNGQNIVTEDSGSIIQAGWLVKSKTSPRVYYAESAIELRWITNEAAAQKYFGVNWYLDIKEFDDLEAMGLRFGDYIL